VAWNHNIVVGLEILRVLNDLNKKSPGGCKVPYETFYLTELVEKVNLPHDYIRWLTEKGGFSVSIELYFIIHVKLFGSRLNYPRCLIGCVVQSSYTSYAPSNPTTCLQCLFA
jgi:hypothetical protein